MVQAFCYVGGSIPSGPTCCRLCVGVSIRLCFGRVISLVLCEVLSWTSIEKRKEDKGLEEKRMKETKRDKKRRKETLVCLHFPEESVLHLHQSVLSACVVTFFVTLWSLLPFLPANRVPLSFPPPLPPLTQCICLSLITSFSVCKRPSPSYLS